MASVLDNKTDIEIPHKVDCKLNLRHARDVYCVLGICSKRAIIGRSRIIASHTRFSLKYGPHDRGRIILT